MPRQGGCDGPFLLRVQLRDPQPERGRATAMEQISWTSSVQIRTIRLGLW
jgi:hypothetical protein